MEWYWIVLLTIAGVHLINTIVCNVFDEETATYICCGPVWFICWALFYPIRASRRYNSLSSYYRKNGISKIAFIFGKRN